LNDDNDGDGYISATCGGDDCDDDNPDVNPGATEEPCDGLDTDCDGSLAADEIDGDSDNVMICEGDCNDSNGNVYPSNPNTYCDCQEPFPQGTVEVECNGIDEDCNGSDYCPGSCTETADASYRAEHREYEASGLANHLAYFIPPIGIVMALRFWRRKR
jgi:hypothetical protein